MSVLALVLAARWGLHVEREPAATACPDQAAVRRAIAERLGGSQGHFWSRIARKVKRGGAKLPPPE